MADIKSDLAHACSRAISMAHSINIPPEKLLINSTPSEFEGDYSLVVFPLSKELRSKPQEIAERIGKQLREEGAILNYNVVKGFLNCTLPPKRWAAYLKKVSTEGLRINKTANPKKVLVEFSSPNTNKPLHLGHVRNMFLGWSVSELLKAVGHEVIRVQIINDRGIAICKSMLAWKLYGEGETPQSAGIKGDHFVGDYYVKFEEAFKEEYANWQKGDGEQIRKKEAKEDESAEVFFKRYKNQYFNLHSPLGRQAKDLLIKWENGDTSTVQLWQKMNTWVYKGFDETYKRLGIDFDKNYYESDTYLLGKEMVNEGLESGHFFKKEDGSVWVDLENEGLDQKILLRSDGTSVYMTQDLGTAEIRYADFGSEEMIYVTADEQNYHFKVLFEIAGKLKRPYSEGMYHLSYGMVELPHGKMKSREGTVVDADDLLQEVIDEARVTASEKGEIQFLNKDEQYKIVEQIGLAALKFYMIKVSPRKRMVFDPKESVDLHGQTGPYIQNAYVRIQSLLRKASEKGYEWSHFDSEVAISSAERDLMRSTVDFEEVLNEAANKKDPSLVANYCYQLAKMYHRFYSESPILPEEETLRSYRLALSAMVGDYLKKGMSLIGIHMPNKM